MVKMEIFFVISSAFDVPIRGSL